MADVPESSRNSTPSRGGSPLVPVLLALNSLLVIGLIAAFLLRGPRAEGAAPHPPDPAAAAAQPGPTQKLADFVVHLRNAEADRYARVSFEIEVATEEDRVKLAAFVPRIRDAFIAYLSDRTLEEMRGSEAIRRTKEALEARLPKLAPAVAIRALYVTDLVIQ